MKRTIPAFVLLAGAIEQLLIAFEHVDFLRQIMPAWLGKVVNQQIALALLVIGMIGLLLRERNPVATLPEPITQTPASTPAPETKPLIDFRPTFEIKPDMRQTQTTQTGAAPVAAPMPDAETAHIQFVEDRPTCIAYASNRPRYLADDSMTHNGIVAVFENALKPAGTRTPIAWRVAARLTFRNDEGEQSHVNYAAWHDEITRYVTFKGGEQRRLVVAFDNHDGSISTLENHNEHNPFARGIFRPGMVVHGPVPVPIIKKCSEIRIQLVDGDVTVFQGTFEARSDAKGIMRLRLCP